MKNNLFKKSMSVFLSVLMLMSCWVWVAPTEAEAASTEVKVTTSFTLSPNGNRGATDWTRLALTGESNAGGTSVVFFRFTNADLQQMANLDSVNLQLYAYSCNNRLSHNNVGVTVNADIYYISQNASFVSGQGTNKNANVADTGNAVLGTDYTYENAQNKAKTYFGLSDATKVGSFEQPAINGQDNASLRTGDVNVSVPVTDIVKQKAASGEDLSFIVMLRQGYSCSGDRGWSDIYINSDTIALSGYNMIDELKSRIEAYEGYFSNGTFYTNLQNNYKAYNDAKRYYDAVTYGGVQFDATLAKSYMNAIDTAIANTGLNDTYVDYLNAPITSQNGTPVSAAYRKNVIWYPWDFSWDITSNNARPEVQDTFFYFTMPNTIVGITNDSETTFPLHSFFWTTTGSRYVRYVIAGSGTISSGVVGSSDFATMAPWKISNDNNRHTTSALNPGDSSANFGNWVFENDYRTDLTLDNFEDNSSNFSYSQDYVYQVSSYAQINKSTIGVNATTTYKKVDQGFTFATANSANGGSTDYGNHYASNYSNYGGALHVVYMDTYKNNYENWKTLIPAISYKDYNGFVYSDATNVTTHLDYASEIPLNLNLTEANRVGDISSTVTVWAQNINKGANDLKNAKTAGTTRVTNKYVDLIDAIKNSEAAYADGSAKYTYASWNNFVAAYNAAKAHMASLNPADSNVQYSSDATAIGNLATALNNARNALEVRTYDVTYENMFSFSSWANSASGVIGTPNKGTMSYDINAGTITVTNNGANTQTDPHDHYTSHGFGNGHYNMTLVPGETYTFEYTTSDGTGDQVHIFFYDNNGNAVANKANSGNPFAHAYGTGRGTHTISFTAPENATKAAFRFGSTVLGDSITFSNIYMYSHTRGDYADIANWTDRPNRTVFTYGQALGTTLEVPERAGYTFDGWWVDSINPNGQKDEGEQVTDGSGTVVATLQNFGIVQDWVLHSEWTANKYTVIWKNEDGTVLETDSDVLAGTTPSYDGTTPTKAADSQYTYTFKGWSPEVAEVTGDVTYTAVFEKTQNSFTVTWKFADGRETTESYAYGATPTAPSNTQGYNDANGHHVYLWPALSAVTSDVTYEEALSTTGHTPGAAATCQAAQTCTVCGAVLVEKLAHTEEIIPAVPASCTTPGKTEGKKCSDCGEILVAQQDTALADHTEEIIPAVESTCTATGLTAGKKCSVCGEILVAQTETAKKEHSWNDGIVTKKSTCITDGVKTYTCTACGGTKTEVISKTGVHVYGEWAQFNNGTTHRRTCTADANCTAFEEETHNFNGALRQMSGNNYHQYKCEKCEAYGVGTTMNVGEACFGDGTTFTQINEATHKETCKCGREQTDSHDYSSWAADPENKTDGTGQMSRTCSECNYKQTTSCDYEVTDSSDATCEGTGYITYECEDCGNGYSEILTATGHSWDEGVVTTNATCSAEGVRSFTCLNDSNHTKKEAIAIDENAHKYGDWTQTKAPTCSAEGEKERVCEYDDTHVDKETVEIDANAHNYSAEITARPTQNTDGTWTKGTYTYTCKNNEAHTYTEDAARADYTEFDEAVAALEALKEDSRVNGDALDEVNNALALADAFAKDLVATEQNQVDEIVIKLKKSIDSINAALDSVGMAQPIVNSNSGLKVQFLKETGAEVIESIQLNKDGGFDTARLKLTNNNSTLPITITNVTADKAYIDSVGDGAEIAINGSRDLRITAPTDFNEAGLITYTITYKVGSDATDYLMDKNGNAVEFVTKAYIYVKSAAVVPYHWMQETVNLGDENSNWHHYFESVNYGDFELVYNNKAPNADFGNSNLIQDSTGLFDVVKEQYDFENSKCYAGCTGTGTTPYVKGDAHAATYRYYIDTSLADTYEKAGLRVRLVEDEKGFYHNAPLKYVRLANNQAYLDSISGDDKTFSVTLTPSASGTQGMSWTATSKGDLTVSQYNNPDQNNYVFGYHHPNEGLAESTAYFNFSGKIPQNTTEAKLMFSPRMEFNGPNIAFAEAVTMTTHLYITSYDKGALRSAVNAAEQAAYNKDYFTTASWTAYENALATAKTVLGKAETTQTEVDTATTALTDAVAALTRAEYVLTVTHSIRENADKNGEVTGTKLAYYLLVKDSSFEAPLDAATIALDTINKNDDAATLTITGTTEHTYNYWFINEEAASDALKKAQEIIDNSKDYSEEFVEAVKSAKEALENLMADTNAPESQSEFDEAVNALTALTDHTCVYEGKYYSNGNGKDGTHYQLCTGCGAKSEAVKHTWDNGVENPEADCENEGTMTYTCTADGCGATYTEAVAADDHSYGEWIEEIPATCLKEGTKGHYECSVCHKYFAEDRTTVISDLTITKLAHSYTGEYKWNNSVTPHTHSQKCVNGCNEYGNKTVCTFDTVVTAPTCYDGGYTTYTCTVCKNSYQSDYTTREHIYVYAPGNGTQHTVTCQYDNCNYASTENCSGGTATCTDKAVCDKCNTGYGTALDHDWAETTYSFAADGKSCTATRVCNRDASHNETVNATITSTIKNPATCTIMGTTTYTATFTVGWAESKTQDVQDIPANDHTFGDWTPNNDGTHTRECIACTDETGRTETDTCTFGEWTQTKAPSCTEKGEKERTCTLCSYTETADIPALNHTDEDNDGYCDRDGELICDHVGQDTVVKNDKEATCLEDGYTGDKHCAKCDVIVEYGTKIEKLGHKDENKDHTCDNKNCDVYQGTHEDTDKDHACDYGCSVSIGDCKDNDKDHDCDYGCDKVYGEHVDTNKDHICDYGCSVSIGDCKDTDKDHACDYGCDKYFGEHVDADLNHTCDYGCAESIGDCKDTDKDHACDYGCDKYFGEHVDSDKNHTCDYGCAESIGDCKDTDKDHACDYGCDKVYGEHVDADKNHTCDYGCAESIGDCKDTDKDHDCDYGCDKYFGTHSDSATDKDHVCDYGCKEVLENCSDADKDGDHTCDICGKENVTSHTYTEATCTTPKTCTECGSTDGTALDHDWAETTYSFAADGSSCTATRVCNRDASHNETVNATISSKIKTPATCEGKGTTTYTATFTVDWAEIRTLDVEDIAAINHDWDKTKSETNLTRPVLVDGVWTKGYYTYTCKNDPNHTTREDIDRAFYNNYEAAWNSLEGLLDTDLTQEAKTAIQKVLDDNNIDKNLIASEQDIVDAAEANLKYAFEQYKGSLKTYTVTFVIDGTETKVTVISGQSAIAPTDVKKAYDDTYHYSFNKWDKEFTNVTNDLTVTAEFNAEEHSYTHTDKDNEYHTDSCTCGYSKEVKHTETSVVTTKASCYNDGVRTYTCSVCGGTRTETIAKRTHDIIDTTVALEPTCSATGIMNQKCKHSASEEYEACDYTTTREMDKVSDAHKAESDYTVIIKATCEADGYKAILCEDCDAELSKESITKRAHTYTDNGQKSPATCLAEGVMNTICTNEETETHQACTHESTRSLPKLAHSYTGEYKWNNSVTPHTHSQKCVNGCNEYGNETKCTFDTVVTAPTCYDGGYTTYTCTVCKNSYNGDYTAKREHKYVYAAGNGTSHEVSCEYKDCNYTLTENCSGGTATCTDKAVCDKCKTAWGEKNSENHVNVVTDKAVESTCYSTGLTEGSHCEACGTTIIAQTETKMKEHIPADAVKENVVPATCYSEGSYDEVVYCSVEACKHEINRTGKTIEKIAHTPADAVRENVVPATCYSEGSYDEVVYCSIEACKHEISRKTITTPKLSHKDENPRDAVCDLCGTSLTCNHPETTIRGRIIATCVTEGYTGDTHCKICGDLLESGTVVPTTDHRYGERPSTVINATCITERTEVYKCENCTATKRVVQEKDKNKFDSHSVVRVTKVEPTCEKSGFDVTYCTFCSTNIEVIETKPTGHIDENGDGNCDIFGCGGKLTPSGTTNKACSCLCHKEGWFWNLIYKIVCFFWKLFKISPSCACGNIHY